MLAMLFTAVKNVKKKKKKKLERKAIGYETPLLRDGVLGNEKECGRNR